MKISYPHPQQMHYLTVAGKFITPNTTVAGSQITGALTATTATDWVSTPNHHELVVNVTVQSVSGTTPTLDVYFDVLDPIESNNRNVVSGERPPLVSVKLDPTQITSAPTTLRAIIAHGSLTVWENNVATVVGNMNVPWRWQVRFVVGGTTPSFGVIATYEARE